jgi:hypothetical protein
MMVGKMVGKLRLALDTQDNVHRLASVERIAHDEGSVAEIALTDRPSGLPELLGLLPAH